MSTQPAGAAPPPRRLAFGDNPFLSLEWRRQGRRTDWSALWPPLLLCLLALPLWWLAERGLAPAGPFTRWHGLLALHATLVAAAAYLPAWRAMAEVGHAGNVTALRLARLRPLEAMTARLAPALLSGLRAVFCGLPLYLVLALRPGPPAPDLVGCGLVLAGLAAYATCLGAAGGAAAVRSRNATIDHWTDFVFNVRTLAAVFLNPAWLLLAVLHVLRFGVALGAALTTFGNWFGWPLPYLALAVPVALWLRRQMAGLATEVHGETPGLARMVVRSQAAAYASLALLVLGLGWATGFDGGGLARYWDLLPDRPSSARLLLALLLLAATPLPLMAAYAAALATGLRSGTADGDERLPAAGRALARVVGAVLGALAVPVLVYAVALRLGGWAPTTAGRAYLSRALLLATGASLTTAAVVVLLGLATRLPRRTRELFAVAVVAPVLAGPFCLQATHWLGRAVAALSPITALLWLPPDAATGVGLTGDLHPPIGWPTCAATQLGWAALLFAVAAWRVRCDGGRPVSEPAGPRRMTSERWPLLSLDLLLLHRRGWLLSPLAMLLMPVLALSYVRLHHALESVLGDSCWLFLWHQPVPGTTGPQQVMVIVVASIGSQLLLHPAGLAGVRSFARDLAESRLDAWWLTPLTIREIVLARYLGVVTPFAVFYGVSAPLLLLGGAWSGQSAVAVAGLAHWLALILLLPAATLAGTIAREWKGQGLGFVVGLEVGRLVVSRLVLADQPVATGVLWANGALLLAAVVLTVLALRVTAQRLARLRAGVG